MRGDEEEDAKEEEQEEEEGGEVKGEKAIAAIVFEAVVVEES